MEASCSKATLMNTDTVQFMNICHRRAYSVTCKPCQQTSYQRQSGSSWVNCTADKKRGISRQQMRVVERGWSRVHCLPPHFSSTIFFFLFRRPSLLPLRAALLTEPRGCDVSFYSRSLPFSSVRVSCPMSQKSARQSQLGSAFRFLYPATAALELSPATSKYAEIQL